MTQLDKIGEDLFNKIRGRFPSVTIGDEDGNVTNEPSAARFFDFDYKTDSRTLGKVSVSISEDDGLTVIYSRDFIQNENEMTQNEWYNFLKELRVFSKKRMLDFSVRDINKSNLNKRDYQFLANRSGDDKMNESKLYGTHKVSYQKFDNARLVIKHTESINVESIGGRTQKIGAIYIESSEGERFKYPFRHLSGARAMARHVSEGGKPYDDFGKHITGLSEELNKLRKFKTYMGRSSVMAESLAGYMDIVKERISTVKKTIESLQKPAYYQEAVSTFEAPVMEDVPADVAENWIDELTIKQFNEELADVFPYIYNLVKEGTKAKTLGPDDLIAEEDEDKIDYKAPGVKKTKDGKYWAKSQSGTMKIFDKEDDAKKHATSNESIEEFELEQAFEDIMGQFSDHVCEDCGNPSWRTLSEAEKQKGVDGKVCWKGYKRMGTKMKGGKRVDNCVKVGEASDFDTSDLKPGDTILVKKNPFEKAYPHKIRRVGYDKVEIFNTNFMGDKVVDEIPLRYIVGKVDNPVDEASDHNFTPDDLQQLQKINNVDDVKRRAIELITTKSRKPMKPEKVAWFKRQIAGKRTPMDVIKLMYDLMLSGDGQAVIGSRGSMGRNSYRQRFGEEGIEDTDEGNAYAHAVRKAKMDGKKKGDKVKGPDGDEITLEKEAKTPLGEFILSYYDRETGEFPKGETAVLTMVEKDYGEQFIEPAKAFIESIHQTFESFQMSREPQQMEDPEFDRMKELAGLR